MHEAINGDAAMTRKLEGCLNCGEVREMAAHGLCFACYRREERAGDRRAAGVDRHNPGVRREHKKILRGFTGVLAGLSDLGVSRNDVLEIRKILDPYVESVRYFLAPAPEQKHSPVNVERGERAVHCSQATETSEDV
jgi:hypothetical protein